MATGTEIPKIELKKIDIPNGETLAYLEREGGNEVLVLVHGNMVSSNSWDLLIENLDPRFKIYAPDLRGQGASTYNHTFDSHRELAEDLKQFADALGLKNFNLAGWSSGGGPAMYLAADHPEYVKKLILLESVSSRGYPMYVPNAAGQPDLTKRLKNKEDILQDTQRTIPISAAYQKNDRAFIRFLFDLLLFPDTKPSPERYETYLDWTMQQRNLVDIYNANNVINLSNHNNGLVDGTGEGAKITAPTLVLQGTKSLVIPRPMADEILEDLPNSKLVLLEGCGHWPLVEKLDLVVKEIEAFMSE